LAIPQSRSGLCGDQTIPVLGGLAARQSKKKKMNVNVAIIRSPKILRICLPTTEISEEVKDQVSH
jgi:hypothetical protein